MTSIFPCYWMSVFGLGEEIYLTGALFFGGVCFLEMVHVRSEAYFIGSNPDYSKNTK